MTKIERHVHSTFEVIQFLAKEVWKSNFRQYGQMKKQRWVEESEKKKDPSALCGTNCIDQYGFPLYGFPLFLFVIMPLLWIFFKQSMCRNVSQWQCAAVICSHLQSRRGISKTRSRGSILQLLDDAGGKYNFVYMPAGRSTHAGLAIVNFVDAEACHRCFLALKNMQDLKKWQ